MKNKEKIKKIKFLLTYKGSPCSDPRKVCMLIKIPVNDQIKTQINRSD